MDGTTCEECFYKDLYDFDCESCDSVDAAGYSTCTVCRDSWIHSYTKTVYDLTTGLEGTEDVTECWGHCPPYYVPVFSVTANSNKRVESTQCTDQTANIGAAYCYGIHRIEAGSFKCSSC